MSGVHFLWVMVHSLLSYYRNNLSYGTRYYLKTGKSSQNTRFKWLDSEGNLDLYVKDNTSGYRDIPSDTQVQSVLYLHLSNKFHSIELPENLPE